MVRQLPRFQPLNRPTRSTQRFRKDKDGAASIFGFPESLGLSSGGSWAGSPSARATTQTNYDLTQTSPDLTTPNRESSTASPDPTTPDLKSSTACLDHTAPNLDPTTARLD